MAGQVTFEYDPVRNLVFSEDHAKLETEEQVDAFFEEYRSYWEALGKKSWLVTKIDGLFVAGQVADYYAERSRQIMGRHLLGFARWATDSWARMSVRTTALKARMPATIHESRAEAEAAIEEMRRTGYVWIPDPPPRD
ncbi:MAG TPA: hypothetical protein VMT19_01680 [Thermoanaerobaculaceae bacterium]|nr:hypothetical protein [Thermoanaerobaculaceae bacterium]